MNWEEVRNHLKKSPFQPFRVHMSDGSSYDVPHPDFMLVSRREIVIGTGSTRVGAPAQLVYCDPLHITRIEPRTNGEPSPSDQHGRSE